MLNPFKRKKTLNRSIYFELLTCIFISLAVSFLIFLASYVVLKRYDILVTSVPDYEQSRNLTNSKVFDFMNKLYQETEEEVDFNMKIENAAADLPGDIYVADQKGCIKWERIEDSLVIQDWIDVKASREKAINQSGNEYYAVYNIMVGRQNCSVIHKVKLEPIYIYSYELVFLASITFAGTAFFIMIFFSVRRKIRYIQYLDQVLKEISHGKLDYEAQIQGRDELARMAVSINEMEHNLIELMEAQKRESRKSNEFVTNMSHDLKTPLTIIIGYLDIIRNEQYRSETEKNVYLTTAYEKALSLKDMIIQLFELTKGRDSDYNINYISANITRIVKQMTAEFEPMAAEGNLHFIQEMPDHDIYVYMDLEKMTGVFYNLMHNAVKYSSENGCIQLSIKDEEKSVLISISNPCNCMDAEELVNIFEKFYRGDKARNSSVEGNGIGLAVVKKTIEMHNGKIWAEYGDGCLSIRIRLRKNT